MTSCLAVYIGSDEPKCTAGNLRFCVVNEAIACTFAATLNACEAVTCWYKQQPSVGLRSGGCSGAQVGRNY